MARSVASVVTNSRRIRRGLTLVELVFVVAILAILAAFLAPRLGFIRNLARSASAADQVAEVVKQTVLFNGAFGTFPQGWDTLTNSSGTLSPALDSGLSGVLTPTALDATGLRSIVGQISPQGASGTAIFYDLDDSLLASGTLPGDIGTIQRVVTTASTGSQATFAQVRTDNAAGQAIYKQIYGEVAAPGGVPTDGTRLIALGAGPNNGLVGKSALQIPVINLKDTTKYNRAIILLKIFPTGSTAPNVPAGSAASTSTGLTPDGKTIQGALRQYVVDQNR
jgi:prepilin-type N-terminal cleavage/methylation domain-containing protein